MPLPASTSALRPPSAHRPSRTKRRLLAVTSLGLAGLIAGLLTGCGSGILPSSTTAPNPFAQAAGNWQISSSAATAARLPAVGGSLSVSSGPNAAATVTGILHPLSTANSAANSCLPASTALPVNGAVDASGQLALSANLPNGGTLAVAGTLAADRKSLSNPTYTITGGPCASPAPQTSAQSIHPRDPAPPSPPSSTKPSAALTLEPSLPPTARPSPSPPPSPKPPPPTPTASTTSTAPPPPPATAASPPPSPPPPPPSTAAASPRPTPTPPPAPPSPPPAPPPPTPPPSPSPAGPSTAPAAPPPAPEPSPGSSSASHPHRTARQNFPETGNGANQRLPHL